MYGNINIPPVSFVIDAPIHASVDTIRKLVKYRTVFHKANALFPKQEQMGASTPVSEQVMA